MFIPRHLVIYSGTHVCWYRPPALDAFNIFRSERMASRCAKPSCKGTWPMHKRMTRVNGMLHVCPDLETRALLSSGMLSSNPTEETLVISKIMLWWDDYLKHHLLTKNDLSIITASATRCFCEHAESTAKMLPGITFSRSVVNDSRSITHDSVMLWRETSCPDGSCYCM